MEATTIFNSDSVSDNRINAGFRLQYLEVWNWGTFHNAIWRIRPDGYNALLTGDIGSGKSTIVDALTCLLVPHNRIVFNKAAGAENRERSLISYVKGEYKKEKETITQTAKKIYLRPNDNTYTVLIGNFYNKGYEEYVCLAQIFWIGSDGKIEKLLVISTTPLTVKEHFSGFHDKNELKKRLRNINGLQLFNDNFSQYSEHFRRLFGMNSDKAIDLFYQTVSMKSVSSLTTFVREQMLERTDVKEQIEMLLKRFDDLNKAHDTVVHAREQFQILKPLTESSKEYDTIGGEIEQIEAMIKVMPSWFALQKLQLLEQAIQNAQRELEKAVRLQENLDNDKTDLEKRKLGILQDIDNNGGKRIEQIAEEIKRHEQDKATKKKDFEEYDRLATGCGLPSVQEEKAFQNNIDKATRIDEKCAVKDSELRLTRDDIVSKLRKHEDEYDVEQQELKSLKARKTQIPGWLIGFREQLCDDLRITEDELPFAGELIKVADNEPAWEGAIEKLLRDVGISLLVPRQHYRSVSKYINDNMLKSPDGRGIKLTYLEADLEYGSRMVRQLNQDSVVCKVNIKPETAFREWLESYLQRSFGDFLCVEVQALQNVSFGITRQGLIKSGKIRHTKDDRRSITDRRHYVLGWSNTDKIQALDHAVLELGKKIELLTVEKQDIEKQQNENNILIKCIAFLLSINDFSRINWQYHVEKIHLLEQERYELLNNNNLLALLQSKKTEVAELIRQVKEKERDVTEKVGGMKKEISNYQEQIATNENILQQSTTHQRESWFPFVEKRMSGITFTLRSIENRQVEFRKQFEGDNGELKKLRMKHTNLRSAIEQKMREIKEHSNAEYSEIAANIEACSEYLQKFQQLASEDLQRHEQRFRDELKKNTINSIAVFDNKLEKHEKDIKQKIKAINQHLSEIVYNTAQDTYITIQMDVTPNREVRQFKEDLKMCYANSLSDNGELYTEEKYRQVKQLLDRFASADNSDKEWTNTVTDVRQWFEFNASERYRADDLEKEFYEGSGGKSGGQKEKLAYTILASALAYQFGLQFGESQSRSFRFVVIDEAFGRGSDESTRYGLELFKQLNLQLLIVTPLQKIHIIEEHVNSFDFISNREGNNSQISNLTKEEYLKEKTRHNNPFRSNTQNGEV